MRDSKITEEEYIEFLKFVKSRRSFSLSSEIINLFREKPKTNSEKKKFSKLKSFLNKKQTQDLEINR